MRLSVRTPPYKIPEYSLTGDLLSYLTCGLQYRYHSKGSLPPSTPVQLWFGEFIHSFMEEAYIKWKENKSLKKFPWSWDPQVRQIELRVYKRLRAKGLDDKAGLFCPFDQRSQLPCRIAGKPDYDHPHKLLASRRAEAAVNIWGPHLFPLINDAEVRLSGICQMPSLPSPRCNYYGITGIIDVIGSVNLKNARPNNLILRNLRENQEIHKLIESLSKTDYEVIIDYKGMRRPAQDSRTNLGNWFYHEWQVLTYSWLRRQQPESKPIVASIIFYLNELCPSQEDVRKLRIETFQKSTDVAPLKSDLKMLKKWKTKSAIPQFSTGLLQKRSIRIIPITEKSVKEARGKFDEVVSNIEKSVLAEMSGKGIKHSWQCRPDPRNCTVCDFKTYCPKPDRKYCPTVP